VHEGEHGDAEDLGAEELAELGLVVGDDGGDDEFGVFLCAELWRLDVFEEGEVWAGDI